MAVEIPKRLLGELVDNCDNVRVPVREADRHPGPYPYYGASGIVDYVDKYLFDGEYLLVAEDGENLRTLNTPVVFLARGKFWVNNHAHVVKGNRYADTRYLLYALTATHLGGFLTGSTMPKLTQGNLSRIPIPVPHIAEQRAIASVLGTLDDKIELNRRMNETLEAMARALFKSWFIDFDPVHAKAEGRDPSLPADIAALFPDSFEESEFGEIPAGWKVTELGELVSFSKGKKPAQTSPVPMPGLEPVILIETLNDHASAYANPAGTVLAESDDVLMVMDGASSGRVEIGVRGVVGSTLAKLEPKCKSPGKRFIYLIAEFLETEAKQHLTGTSIPHADKNWFCKQLVCLPASVQLLEVFHRTTDALLQRSEKSRAECRALEVVRDTLLPKLLSGEVRVKDVDQSIEAHA